MKIQLVSDLHLDAFRDAGLKMPRFQVNPRADILVFAGDIDKGLAGMEFVCAQPICSLYVLGNLEHYGLDVDEAAIFAKRKAHSPKVRILQNDSTVFGGVRFLGATLWTDFRASPVSQGENMASAAAALNDYRLIRDDQETLTPAGVLRRHEETLTWMGSVLAEPFDGPTIVVSHHAPHPHAIPNHRVGHRLQAAYTSRLTALMSSVDYWLHGHVHAAAQYKVQGCQVFCNPFGSPSDHRYPLSVAQASLRYDPDLLIEVKVP